MHGCFHVGTLICGAARPTPSATWDVASQIAPHGAGKSNEKKIFCSAFSQKICASFMPERASFGIKRPVFTRGMGATRAPIYNDPLRMCVSLARSAQWEWPCHCRGVGAASAPTSKNLCASFPNISSCFFSVFCTCFMPARASFGIKRPAFTWGHGGDASPHIQPPPLRKSA